MSEKSKKNPGEGLTKLIRTLTYNWQLRKVMNGENSAVKKHFNENMTLHEDLGNGEVIMINKHGVKFRVSGKGLSRRITRIDD